MGIFNKTLNNLDDLFWEQVKDLYDAEQRISKALPKMESAAKSPQLKSAFKQHLQQTKAHLERLEQIFQRKDRRPETETCEAMKGLIEEGEESVNLKGKAEVRDAALIASAQRVEHYEMASYGTARALAEQIGFQEGADLLQQTLREEQATDKLLSEIAIGQVNKQAQGGMSASR